MNNLKPYEKYKPTNIEWIGEIPEYWEISKLRHLGKFTSSGIDKKLNEDEPLVRIINYTDVYGNKSMRLDGTRNYMEVSCPEEKIKEHQVIKGDLIFTPSSETIEDIGLSALVDENFENTAYSYHVLRFRFNKEISHDFKKYLCNNHFVLNQFSSNAKGTTRQILNREIFNNILVFLPKINEQTAIANYLDEKTAQIDTLISKKQRLIELLKEERTAIINEAVSGKGKNWEKKKLKYVANVNSSIKHFDFEKDSDMEVVFLPMEKVSEKGMINQDTRKKINEVSTGFTYFERGDVILAKITPCFENGKGALLYNLDTEFGFGSTEFHTLRASNKITKEYLFYQTKTDRFMQIGEAFMTGSAGQKRVPTSFVEEFLIDLPSIKL